MLRENVNLPIFRDSPPCVAWKLEWKPQQPRSKNTTSKVKETPRFILKERLTYKEAAPVGSGQEYWDTTMINHAKKGSNYIKSHCLAACCLKMMSNTLKASREFCDSWPWRAAAIAGKGILAGKLISTLNVLDWDTRLLFLSLSLLLPWPSGLSLLVVLDKIISPS